MFNSLANLQHLLLLAIKLIKSNLSFKDNTFNFNNIVHVLQIVILFKINLVYSAFYSQYLQAFKHPVLL